MSDSTLRRLIGALPPPYDREIAGQHRQSLVTAAAASESPQLDAYVQHLMRDPVGIALLDALFGNSPYLTALILDDPARFQRLLEQSPDTSLSSIMDGLHAAGITADRPLALTEPFRRAKAELALLAAIADIGQVWQLHQVTGALSLLAETVLQVAIDVGLRELANAGELSLPDLDHPSRGSGLAVIAMGKLGARELNYSSDIDLIVFFDQEVTRYTGRKSPRDMFVRQIQILVKLLQEHTRDGYVFRTDLRLRPDPASTPIVMSMDAAEHYYESLGQNWERAAMIKARTVAGDIDAGQAFLGRIAPFIWRKHLDYAAIQDIHSIKRQIHSHRGHSEITVAGHDVKVGRGGIREIEFFAQTQQLIAGGRDRRLRVPATLAAIAALRATGRVSEAVEQDMAASYDFLRRVEHRIQMVNDEQTQVMPADKAGVDRIARFMGYDDTGRFEEDLLATLRRVQQHYARLFEQAPALGDRSGSLVFTGTDADPDTIATIGGLGFSDPAGVDALIRGWHHGRYRAMRSTRARELLTELTPRMLTAFAATASPQHAFIRFDEFLKRLPGGIQLFSLFQANPHLFDLIAEIMGTAPRLAEYLAQDPSRFDAMLSPSFFGPPATADALTAALADELAQGRDYQDALDIARRFANDQRLRIGVGLMRGALDHGVAARALSDLADAVLRALLPVVEADVARQHGRLKGGAFAVLGMGRLGSQELTIESDLDLMFIYDDSEAESNGPKPLGASQYFAKLSQRLIAALTALTGEGRLFEVDMRLRPSGNKGPVAVGFSGFTRYQRQDAWTWEHLALTRARVVAGPAKLAKAIEAVIAEILTRHRDPSALVVDVAEMRRRMAQARGSADPWDVKNARGGLIDIEFIAQYLMLRFAADDPSVLSNSISASLRNLARAGCLDGDTAAELLDAYGFLSTMLALIRLCHGDNFDATNAPPGLARALARAGKMPDFVALTAELLRAEAKARDHFRTLVEIPASAATVPASSPPPGDDP